MSDIGDYYKRCAERLAEARQQLKEAKERGAPYEEIRRLERLCERVADTGD